MPGHSEVAGQPAGEPALVEISWNHRYLELYVPSVESVREVAFIVKEVIEENCYLRHGISINEGATVIDIGANIGLFGAQALSLVPGGDITYIGVEPCPPLFNTLKRNLLSSDSSTFAGSLFLYNEGFEHVVRPALPGRISAEYPGNVQLFKAAVSGQLGTALITYYPRVPGNSTLRPAEKQQLQGSIMQHLLQDSQTYEVPVITLHQLLREAKLVSKQIDLVKIDVEGEELNVLLGLTESEWAYIQQVVVEVHDVLSGKHDGDGASCAAVDSIQQAATAGSHAPAAAASTVTDDTPAAAACVVLPFLLHDEIEGVRLNAHNMDRPATEATAVGGSNKGANDDWVTSATGRVSCTGAYGKVTPAPKHGGRVLQVVHLLQSFGFAVVIECSLVIDEVAANFTAYARRCHVNQRSPVGLETAVDHSRH